MEAIRILIVEDQTLMRQGMKTILDLEPGLRVVGEAADGEAGVHMALDLRPDVILMDVQMPRLNGIEAIAAICAVWPEARVIILTTFSRDDYVFQGVRAGAVGFLLKDAPVEDLIQTIRRVHAGEVVSPPESASRLLRELISPQVMLIEPLSEREREVLVLLAQGHSNREIAERLVLAEGTVKNHVSNILAKLQAENRTQAADIARRYGLV
ncbi:MAG: response regulator transcription factor [Anaerolineae bacterium]|nr:MAG: response regulator transcription factor [Anaerolineae bacterium]